MNLNPLITGLLLASSPALVAQSPDTIRSYTTAQVQGEPPQIDGQLNDAAWEQVPWGGGDFKQVYPDKNKPASVKTLFKILYDARNLYVAFRCYDPEPDKIVSRMSRRDGFEGDWVEINIDSYYDKRTAFSFTSSVSGVKGDQYVSNNGDIWDNSWEPIWYLKTSIDKEGWVAELRIPLSQLRFANKPELTWGLQVQRYFFRNEEGSVWQYIPPEIGGWVHLFGDLKGIKGIKPQKQLEIQPYVLAKTETFAREEGNPFRTGSASALDVGLDAKVGITSDITLDLTVNPDFGQVEADPSQVNLSAFELFFQERRPFFIEGNNILDYPLNPWFNSNNIFYSRRIGRTPQTPAVTDAGDEDDGVAEHAQTVRQTTILGAAKLTGKNKKGFSWGLLETVTAPEFAETDSLGSRRTQIVEPTTNYFVVRAQQDINKGNTVVGGIFTATNRDIKDRRLQWLHDDAYTGGVDMMHHWKARMYYFNAKAFMSHVRGSAEAITNTQRSSERYFQRPDNDHASVDEQRRSLTGTGGTLVIGKKNGNLISDLGIAYSSPGLELNDIGFLAQTDNITQWWWMQYRVQEVRGIARWQRYNVNQSAEWDFDRRNLNEWYNLNAHVQFTNFWRLSMGSTYQVRRASNADLRGGPALRYPGSVDYWIFATTDARKKFYVVVNPLWQWGFEHYLRSANLDFEFVYRPVNALNISVAPSLSFNNNQMQYVATGAVNGQDRYVVGEIDQTTARITLRLTYMITPNLSLQYYGQPFGTSGKYDKFKYITNAAAPAYTSRYTHIPAHWLTAGTDQYHVDENSDLVVDYAFDKPDFNFGQFRSNMVMRWEYIPGSTFFLVWSTERNGAFYDRTGPIHERYRFDFNQKAYNIFLLKFTYRFVL